MIFAIFQTKKPDGKSEFIGQTSDPNLAAASDITKRATGEKPKSITFADGTLVATSTENHNLDFVPKILAEDLIIYKG